MIILDTFHLPEDQFYAAWVLTHQERIRRVQLFLQGEDKSKTVFNDMALNAYENFPHAVEHNCN